MLAGGLGGFNFGLGETADMLRESVRSFAAARIAPRAVERRGGHQGQGHVLTCVRVAIRLERAPFDPQNKGACVPPYHYG